MKKPVKLIVSGIAFCAIVFLTQSCGKDTAGKSASGKGVTAPAGKKTSTDKSSSTTNTVSQQAGGSSTASNGSSQTVGANGIGGTNAGELPGSNPGSSAGAAGDICVDSDDEFSTSPSPSNEAPDDLFACRKAPGTAVWHCKVDLDGNEATTNDRPIIDVPGSTSDTGFSCDGVDSLPFQ